MKISNALSVVLIFSVQLLNAQSSFLPTNLGASINSVYDEINPVLSANGKLLFFVRVNHPQNTYGLGDSEDIWFSEALNDSTWSVARRIANLNIARYNAVLGISEDGKTILLNGIFNKKGNIWKKRGLSMATLNGKEWSRPLALKISKLTRKNAGLQSSGSMSYDGQSILLSLSKSYNGKKTAVFLIQKNDKGNWNKPLEIKEFSSSQNNEAPFLTSDNKTIYFSSDRKTKGDYNIYKSIQTGTGKNKWGPPILLSDTINSVGWESYFRTNQKGSAAYFSSTTNSFGKADIFKIKLFEENPFVIISGKVYNKKNLRPMVGRNYLILTDGKSIDSLKINADSATFRIKLPLNKVYQLGAVLPNFTTKPQRVDVLDVKEFTKREVDLYLEPLPYVKVFGKLLVQNTGLPIPFSANAKVLINNLPGDSVKIDRHAAIYETKINYGSSLEMKLTGDDFESLPKTLDLSLISEYQEMMVDLYVAEEKMALISGKILDKKTGNPLLGIKAAKVNVEGFQSVLVVIDTLQSTYELKLPFGSQYTISASAPNYFPLYENIDARHNGGELKIYKDLYIVPIEVGQSIRLNNIFFDPAKATLKKESFVELDRVWEFLTNNPEIKVEIAGHTDNVGNATGNLNLSQNRAQSVATYIIGKGGIPKERILAKGYGFNKPVASNATKEGKSKNRRVEFTILDK